FEPDANYTGPFTFSFRVTDAGGFTDEAEVSLTIFTDLDALEVTVYTSVDSPVNFTLEATGGTEPYTFEAELLPGDPGTLDGAPPDLTYVPAEGFTGSIYLPFIVMDAEGFTSYGSVTIIVAPPLNVSDQYFNIFVNTQLNITLQVQGGKPPYIYDISPVPHGTLTGTPPNLAFTPETDYSGLNSFTVEVTDANGTTASGIVR